MLSLPVYRGPLVVVVVVVRKGQGKEAKSDGE